MAEAPDSVPPVYSEKNPVDMGPPPLMHQTGILHQNKSEDTPETKINTDLQLMPVSYNMLAIWLC